MAGNDQQEVEGEEESGESRAEHEQIVAWPKWEEIIISVIGNGEVVDDDGEEPAQEDHEDCGEKELAIPRLPLQPRACEQAPCHIHHQVKILLMVEQRRQGISP